MGIAISNDQYPLLRPMDFHHHLAVLLDRRDLRHCRHPRIDDLYSRLVRGIRRGRFRQRLQLGDPVDASAIQSGYLRVFVPIPVVSIRSPVIITCPASLLKRDRSWFVVPPTHKTQSARGCDGFFLATSEDSPIARRSSRGPRRCDRKNKKPAAFNIEDDGPS